MASTTKEDPCSTLLRADKGHFVVYSADGRRFMIPLVCLQNEIYKELLEMAEEEFGLPRDSPITLPCDAVFMDYAFSLIQRNVLDLCYDEEAKLCDDSMIYLFSSKNLIRIVRKWQKLAVQRRRTISLPKRSSNLNDNTCSTSTRAGKGHFSVYTVDKTRFMIPLLYLKHNILRELLQAAEEEFGMPRDGPITLPCDAIFMEYALSLIQRHAAEDLQKALLMSMANGHCSSSSQFLTKQKNYQSPICSF
ncbi:hypothetical protein Ancab_028140 [Ancistrocladus abbreviatus]